MTSLVHLPLPINPHHMMNEASPKLPEAKESNKRPHVAEEGE